MTSAAAYGCTAVAVIVAGFGVYAASVLAGHERLAKALLTAAIAVVGSLLKVAGPAASPAVRIVTAACGVARHPAWWARYARTRRHPAPGPGRDDGEKLTREEAQVLGNLDAGRDVRSRT